MNARRARLNRLARSAIVLIVASFLLSASHSTVLAQEDTHLLAVYYFQGILEDVHVDTASSIVHPEALLHTPEGLFRGQEGAIRFASQLRDSFTDLEFAVQKSEVAGDMVVVQFTMTGIHTGTYQEIAPDCARISVSGMAVLQADNSGITEQWIAYDRQTVLDQIYVFSLFNENSRPSCDG